MRTFSPRGSIDVANTHPASLKLKPDQTCPRRELLHFDDLQTHLIGRVQVARRFGISRCFPSRRPSPKQPFAGFVQRPVLAIGLRETGTVVVSPADRGDHRFFRPATVSSRRLAEQLVLSGRSVLFRTCSLLVQQLLIAKRDLRLPKLIKQFSSFEGLIEVLSLARAPSGLIRR